MATGYMAVAISSLLWACAVLGLGGPAVFFGSEAPVNPRAVVGLAIGVLFGVGGGMLSLVTGWGLWRLKGWARWVAIGLAAISLLAIPIGTVIGALIIWYLFKGEVKQAFEAQA